MLETHKTKTVLGRAEKVVFPQLGDAVLHARIDTGAKTSSIWATDVSETPDGLRVRFGSPEDGLYERQLTFTHYDRVRISSSMGHKEVRYKVKMPIVLGGRRIRASFTLADRSTQVYPVLIGRSTLTGKFIVDVSEGSPLRQEEKRRSTLLQQTIIEEHV